MWRRTGMWDALERAASNIPGAQVAKVDARIILPNGGIYQTGGMDEPDRWRGGYADLVIEDEADDVTASGLDMVVVPMLADFRGQRARIGTPKGTGRLASAYEAAGSDPDSSRFLLPWQKTGVFTQEQIAEIKGELDDEEFAQEFECSFTAPNSGSYYGKWLDAALQENRITRILYDPALPVYTSWDLGMHDMTAIWWFQRSPGGEWRFLEYYEDSGKGLDFYVRLVQNKPYVYGHHFLPHDVQVRELTNGGKSRRLYMQNLGMKPILAVPAANSADRVAAVRSILPRAWFDAEGCSVGLKQLRAYRRQWNEHMGVWRAEALHDAASHCADAFGTGVQGSKSPEAANRPRLTEPKPRRKIEPMKGSNGWLAL